MEEQQRQTTTEFLNRPEYKDYGSHPIVFDAEFYTKMSSKFRNTLWTGTDGQMTLMSVRPGEDIGVEVHPDLDQFAFIMQGTGTVYMGNCEESLSKQARMREGYAIIIPAGTYHNIVNDGLEAMKLYSIYSKNAHPFGTVHETKEEAMKEDHE